MSALRKPEEILREAEGLVASGDAKRARELLRDVDPGRLPNSVLVSFGGVSRRAGLPGLAARILFPSVTSNPPQTKLLLEYALSIAALGCRREAQRILAQLDPRVSPEALFYQGVLCADNFDYRESRLHFENYLALERKGTHTLSAHLGRTRALIGQRIFDEAQDEIVFLLEESKQGRLTKRLHVEVLCASALCSLLQQRLGTAERTILEAMGLVGELSSLARGPVMVWKALLEKFQSLEAGDDLELQEQAQNDYVQARVAASKWGGYDLVRLAEHYIAVRTANTEQLCELYYGTPSEAYREWLSAECGARLRVPDEWKHRFFSAVPHTSLLDLEQGEFFHLNNLVYAGNGVHLAPADQRLKLLRGLASDFYASSSLGQLHESMSPNVPFNPFESREFVAQTGKELAAWFKSHSIPMDLKLAGNVMRLVPLDRIAVKWQKRMLFK